MIRKSKAKDLEEPRISTKVFSFEYTLTFLKVFNTDFFYIQLKIVLWRQHKTKIDLNKD